MSLPDTQAALARWIRAPEGVSKTLEQTHEAARREIESLVRSDSTLDAVARLEIYANAYFYRVLGVLSEDFEALLGLLGEEDFHDLITSYLWVEPSRHPSLRYAGQRLPEFIASHPAAAGFRERTPWAASLATFEWARVDAFDAADVPLLQVETLAARPPEEFAVLALQTAPGTMVRRFTHPVDALWRSGVRGEAPELERGSIEVELLIWRRDERVVHRRVDAREAAALDSIREGTTFGELCEWAAEHEGESEAPGRAASWLAQWVEDGFLRDLSAPSVR